ncbi:chalcone isomerase-like protein 1 [Aristolochia californica]|uniref:chalcone isomerase-like protein 1 n=1 Tax=Aristolochia californica TaxID=171875 RepID=UPI0035DBFB9C
MAPFIGERAVEATPKDDIAKFKTSELPQPPMVEKEVKGVETGVCKEGKEEVGTETEPKTGVSFPVKLEDGKQLNAVGMRKKSVLGLGIKIYAFGVYADKEKLKEVLKSKISTAPEKPTKQMYEIAIDSDVPMTMKLVIVFSGLTMNMIKKNFDEGLGASIKKINGGRKNEDLANKVMGAASDAIKLSPGSVIEITKLPGFVIRTKVKDEVISTVESELLCRAYFHMYLGDDPFDKDAKERFGASLLSLF